MGAARVKGEDSMKPSESGAHAAQRQATEADGPRILRHLQETKDTMTATCIKSERDTCDSYTFRMPRLLHRQPSETAV